jgi:hypothetical protein
MTNYLAGRIGGCIGYWKNGVITQLSSSSGTVNSINVSGNDVYVAGTINNRPILWKNTAPIISSDTTGEIFDVKVVKGSVFASGCFLEPISMKILPLFWKNGVPYFLNTLPSTSEGKGYSLFVNNSDVYVCGYLTSVYGNNAIIWRNGGIVYVDTNSKSFLYSITIYGNNVYAVGVNYDSNLMSKPMLVANGANPMLLNNYGGANNVFVNGGDVYISGYTTDSISKNNTARVWKNNSIYLSMNNNSNSSALASTMFNNDLYTVGYNITLGTGFVWKNGVAVYTLSNFMPKNIFVK